jgi:hypothetical protein
MDAVCVRWSIITNGGCCPICMYVCMYVGRYVSMSVCMSVYICMYTCMYVCIYLYVYMYVRVQSVRVDVTNEGKVNVSYLPLMTPVLLWLSSPSILQEILEFNSKYVVCSLRLCTSFSQSVIVYLHLICSLSLYLSFSLCICYSKHFRMILLLTWRHYWKGNRYFNVYGDFHHRKLPR